MEELKPLSGFDTNRSVDVLKDYTKPKQSTISGLSDDDIASIWGYISEFIIKQLQQNKGVHIHGLGTFTYTKKVTGKSSGKKAKEINRPVFVISEKFVLQHCLPNQKIYQTGEIPVVPLNFAAVAFESPYHRDVVEACAKEVLTWLGRSVQSNSSVEFVFPDLGRLTIKEKKVKMRFFKEFINSLDDGKDVMKSMVNRPFTPDSVMSDRPITSRPGTTTLILPSVAVNKPPKPLPAIAETENEDEHNPEVTSDPGRFDENHENQLGGSAAAGLNTVREREFSTSSQLKADLPTVRKPSTGAASHRNMTTPTLKRSNTSPNLVSNRPPGSSRAESAASNHSECCHKASAGQELCYLCHQRDVRNIPVDFLAERQKRIEEEDKLLAQYQNLRDTEAILKEQEKLYDARNMQKSISAFNLGVADAVKDEKSRKPGYYNSFLFQKRPHTPHKFFGQATYYEDLNNQVESRTDKEKRLHEDKVFLEKLEQIQIAEDLAAQREAYLKEKHNQKEALKRALDTQLKYLPEQLPKAVPDSDEPIFGLHDASSNDKIREKAEREEEIKKELLEIAREKKKEKILTELLNQKEEEEMLKDVKREFVEDNVNKHNRLFNQRRQLEADWLKSMQVKQQRDEEENLHRLHGGALLLDQAHVSRCAQCQRKMMNKGKTNLWKESYYVPGSRLIL
ncbi:coiled-coil domain-containing protein 81-like [Symsagittifera roscoffensis]|uniref:coiled-coil domain-containing protein 81-like n=1 Tax=Symsagittifera roscoffensis TaxID=84072 RepID=UPI00307C09A8